jgi:hypothetical protein
MPRASVPAPKSSPKARATKSAPAALAPTRPFQSPEAPETPSPLKSPSDLPDFVQMFHMLSRQSSQNSRLYGEAILRLQNTAKHYTNPIAKTAASRLAFLNINDYVQSELNKIQVLILVAIGCAESDEEEVLMSFGDHLESIDESLRELDIYLSRFAPDKKAIIIAESGLPAIHSTLDAIISRAYANHLVIDGSEKRRLLTLASKVTAVQKKFGTIAEKVFTGGASPARRTNPKK